MERINAAAVTLQEARGRDSQLALAIPKASFGLDGDVEQITFGALRRRVAQFQAGIARAGLREGDRVVMLFPVSVDFYALALALLASGQVLVFLDGRLDKKRLLRVLRAAHAQAIVSIRPLLRMWPILPALWGTKRIVTDSPVWGATPLSSLLEETSEPPHLALQSPDKSALLSFTSGSTGRPKGADRTHGILLAQHYALEAHTPDRAGEVDMPCFPAVVLYNMACGVSSVLPPIDLRHPGSFDPSHVVHAMTRFGVSSMSGAPAYMRRLGDHIVRAGDPMSNVRRLYVGGAPVSRRLASLLISAFPNARGEAVYGSTEAEPMAGVSLEELASSKGEGYLVGREAPVADIALVDLPEIAPKLGKNGLNPYLVPNGNNGEVLVRGPHVNRHYVGDEDANRRFKVPTVEGDLWHRTGDLARRDAEGRLWLSGRIPDRVTYGGQVLFPYVLEAAVMDAIASVRNAALIAHTKAPEGELVLECDVNEENEVLRATRTLLRARDLPNLAVSFVREIPVDARHQSKIDRPALRALRSSTA